MTTLWFDRASWQYYLYANATQNPAMYREFWDPIYCNFHRDECFSHFALCMGNGDVNAVTLFPGPHYLFQETLLLNRCHSHIRIVSIIFHFTFFISSRRWGKFIFISFIILNKKKFLSIVKSVWKYFFLFVYLSSKK